MCLLVVVIFHINIVNTFNVNEYLIFIFPGKKIKEANLNIIIFETAEWRKIV